MLWNRQQEEVDDSGTLKPLPGTDDYLAATDLYKDEKFAEAEKAFKRVGKKYKKSDIREDALFMQAEAAFQREHYSKAHDVYAVLLKEFPSTRHLDVVSERLFKIGRTWLDFPEVAKLDEVQQVNYEDPKKKLPADEPYKASGRPIFMPNFTNKAEPLFDTAGNGVSALQAIWMNDPTGPLADDAMMLVASHHARKSNFVEADRYFQMLRETFPNSPHLQDSFVLGSHVKLMSYQGPEYEGKTLTEAELLKESTLRLYPEIPDKERLQRELAMIEEAKAAREWGQVEFWLRKGNKRSATTYCHQLINNFPNSTYAALAREKLESFGPEYVSGAVLMRPADLPKQPLLDRILPGSQRAEATNPASPPKRKNAETPPAVKDPFMEPEPKKRSLNPFNRTAPSSPSEEEMSPEYAEEDPSSEPAPKKGWFRRTPPRKLPDDVESDAKEIPAADLGRTRL